MPSRRDWSWFALWCLIGGVGAVAALAVFSPAVLIVPLLVALGGFMATRPGPRAGVPGLISGLGIPALVVAWLNRGGPGTRCWTSATGGGCDQLLDPWPWLLVGLAFCAAGVGVFVRRRRSPSGARTGTPDTGANQLTS